MSYGSNFDLMWDSVSGDHERIQKSSALTHGKVAVSGFWPFLSSAVSEADFENRLSLSLSRISRLVAPEVLDEVVSSLRDDYRLVTGAKDDSYCLDCYNDEPDAFTAGRCDHCGGKQLSHSDPQGAKDYAKGKTAGAKTAEKGGKPWEGGSDEDEQKTEVKKESDDAKDQAEDQTGTDNSADKSDKDDEDSSDTQSSSGKSSSDDDGKDGSKGNQPNWLNKEDRDKSTTDRDKKGDTKKASNAKADAIKEFQDAASKKCATCGDNMNPLGPGQRHMHSENDNHSFKMSAYQPDPTAAQRYYAPYAGLESLPLNNGDLQGPDGFPQDLAEGEQRTPEAYARQTTPGTWSQGQGMPERPMPQGVERGYQPVAVRFDKEGFLVQSVVDPVPGAPLTSNPFYFSTDSQGIEGNGFPQDPVDETQLTDRANDYGDVPPVRSGGSAEGLVDGNGYSRSQPGRTASQEPRNFNVTAGSVADCGGCGKTITFDTVKHDWREPHLVGNYYAGSGLCSSRFKGDRQPHTPVNNSIRAIAADHFNRGHYDAKNGRNYAGEEHQDTEEARSYREGWDAHHNGGHAASDRATQQSLFGHTGSTDGKIVDWCPGCKKPRRSHDTQHGEEVRHLHNDHVRCHGGKTAAPVKGVPAIAGAELAEDVGDPSTPKKPDTWAWDSLHSATASAQFYDPTELGREAALAHGSNVAGHDHSLSFEEALAYTGGYGISNSQMPQFTAGEYLGRPDENNPTGRGPDEFRARTWDAYQTSRPMQPAEHRNVNTPVIPPSPLKSRNIGPENPQFNRDRTDRLEQPNDNDEEEK